MFIYGSSVTGVKYAGTYKTLSVPSSVTAPSSYYAITEDKFAFKDSSSWTNYNFRGLYSSTASVSGPAQNDIVGIISSSAIKYKKKGASNWVSYTGPIYVLEGKEIGDVEE